MALTIDLAGKTVVVTGANSGIGLGIAQKMAEAGANVVGCASTSDPKEFTAAVAKVPSLFLKCDVTQPEDLENLVNRTVEKFSAIDILISNAGANVFNGAAHTDENIWAGNIDLNLASHWRLAKLCKPHLDKTNGVIIVMTSNHAYASIPGCFPYNVTKTALTGLVRSLAMEWGPTIRTVGIAPGFIDTPGNQKWFDSFEDAQQERQRTVDLHPVKKLGTVEEVGAWCVFLSSTYAAFASGTTYVLDGGRSALMQDS